MSHFDKIVEYLRTNSRITTKVFDAGWKLSMTLMVSYFVASTVTALSVTFFTQSLLVAGKSRPGVRSKFDKKVKTSKDLNYRTIRKQVLARNIFNSDGELPEEETPGSALTETTTTFDANAKCKKSSLDISLIGTIFLGSTGPSLATVRQKGYSEADVYRIGDPIIEHEQAIVYAIEPNRIILNNNGAKECIKLELAKNMQRSSSYSSTSSGSSSNGRGSMEEGGSSTYTLTGEYVQEALGPGFSKILEVGRLVPFKESDRMVGFKLIGVKSKSLFKKIGLKSGDVITRVNDRSMAQAEQGFALYEALQEDKEIRIEYLKRGKNPSTVVVQIK